MVIDVYFFLTCLIGGILGTITGVIPGVGAAIVVSLFLPILLLIPYENSIILAMSILYGSQYGGSISAALLNIAGQPICSIAMPYSYRLTQLGRARDVLFTCAYSSLIGGIIGTIFVYMIGSMIGEWDPDTDIILYIVLISSVMIIGSSDNWRSVRNNFLVFSVGGLASLVDVYGNYTGDAIVSSGISIVVLSICVFGISESLYQLIKSSDSIYNSEDRSSNFSKPRMKGLWKSLFFPSIRGSLFGIFAFIPGISWVSTCFASLETEKKISNNKLNIIASVESCNNTDSQVSFIPFLLFGIPLSAISIMMEYMLEYSNVDINRSISMTNNGLFETIILSFLVTNVILFILNGKLASMWIWFISFNPVLIYTTILLICFITLNNSIDYQYELIVSSILIGTTILFRMHGIQMIQSFVAFIIVPKIFNLSTGYYIRRYADIQTTLYDLKYVIMVITLFVIYKIIILNKKETK